MPIRKRFAIRRSRREWIILSAIFIGGLIAIMFLRQRTIQENRSVAWFRQETVATDASNKALMAMFLYVDARQQLLDGGLTPAEQSTYAAREKSKLAETYRWIGEAEREAEKLKPKLAGLADRQRYEKRLDRLLQGLRNTRLGAQRVQSAKTQHEISEALDVFGAPDKK